MKMNDWGVPIGGLKPAATVHKIILQSFAAPNSSSSGGGLQPAFRGSIFGAEIVETAENSLRTMRVIRGWVFQECRYNGWSSMLDPWT